MVVFRNLTIPCIIFLHFLSVFIFAFIYMQFWNKNTSTFIIGAEMNGRAESLDYLYRHNDINSTSNFSSLSIDEFNKKIAPLNVKIKGYINKKNELILFCNSAKIKIDSLDLILDKEVQENMEQLIEYRTQDLVNEMSALETQIKSIKQLNPQGDGSMALKLKIGKLESKYKKIDNRVASIVQEITNDATSNRIDYCRGTLFSESDLLKQRHMASEREIENINKSLSEISRDYRTVVKDFHFDRMKRLSIIDFFYFSLLNSLSNNMGDIIPNSTEVRGFVCLQLFFSLIWLALMVDKIIQRFSLNVSA